MDRVGLGVRRKLRLAGLLWAMAVVPSWAGEPAPVAARPPVVPNKECFECHEAEFKPRKKGLPPEWIGVRPELYAKSVHAKTNCVDCHADIKEAEHGSKVAKAVCTACHEKAATQYATSIHGMSHKMGSSEAASCSSCHGTHEM